MLQFTFVNIVYALKIIIAIVILILLSFNFYAIVKSILCTTFIVLEYPEFDYILTCTKLPGTGKYIFHY